MNNSSLLTVHILFVLMIGVSSFVASIMLLTGRERLGLRVGTLGLFIALTIVNLITFYFSQFYAIGDALGQLALIGIAHIYRWRFFLNPSDDVATRTRGRVSARV